jgi:hypothetical protein
MLRTPRVFETQAIWFLVEEVREEGKGAERKASGDWAIAQDASKSGSNRMIHSNHVQPDASSERDGLFQIDGAAAGMGSAFTGDAFHVLIEAVVDGELFAAADRPLAQV